jgi:hypothetical protein
MIIIIPSQRYFVIIESSPTANACLLVEVASETGDTLTRKDAEDFTLVRGKF